MTTTAAPHVIAVSGQIGSGKTTLIRALAARLGWAAASKPCGTLE
jgi:tRNA A37 threonylcarbamoyladenosine biosynthesis protein TsaE